MKYNRVKAACLIIIVLLSGSSIVRGQQATDSLEIIQRMHSFTEAFSNLQWDEFISFFATDASAFFPPSAKFANRADDKTSIENVFRNVFATAIKAKKSPPYLSIIPLQQKIQMAGNIAIVSFLLRDPAMLGRRTIVLEKRSGIWLIIHLHASGVLLTD